MTAILQFAERFTEKPRPGQMCNHICTLMIARTVFETNPECFAGPGDEPAETT